jgi:hypothetical protein
MRGRLEKAGSEAELLDRWEAIVEQGVVNEAGSVETVIFGFIPKWEVTRQRTHTSNEHWGTIAAREWMKWALAVWAEYVAVLHEKEGVVQVQIDQRIRTTYQRIGRDEGWARECKVKLETLLRKDTVTKQQWLDYWTAKFKHSGGKRQVTLVQLFRGST